MKFIPQDSGSEAYLDINAMSSTNDSQIHSCTLKHGQFDFQNNDKSKLDNLDAWAQQEGFLITKK